MRFSKHTTAAFAAVAMAVPAASLSAAAAPVSPYVDTAAPGAQLRDLGRMAPTNVVHLAFNLRYQQAREGVLGSSRNRRQSWRSVSDTVSCTLRLSPVRASKVS
jgi:hypothetical protein